VDILDQANELREKRAEADEKSIRIMPALFYKMFGDPMTNSIGWEIKKLYKAGISVRYGLGQPPREKEKGLPLIRATNIHKGNISTDNMLYVDPVSVPEGRNAFLKSNEVIVVRSGAYTGDVAQVTKKWEGSVAGYDLIVTPNDLFSGEFIESYLLTPYVQKSHFEKLKSRAGQPHLNAEQLENITIYCPPIEIQMKYSRYISTIRQQKEFMATASSRIENLSQILLSRAFSGKLI
jgi:type I restriction enzyme S subunit